MRKMLTYSSVLLIFLSGFLLRSCEKQEYDLFPLNTGNEFYYTFSYSESGMSMSGTDTWKVISVSSAGNSEEYRIERKFNGILKLGFPRNITDSVRFFEINYDKSSDLLSSSSMFFRHYKIPLKIGFKRHQQDSRMELSQEFPRNNGVERLSCSFKADRGLTDFAYSTPPNSMVRETLHLDSLRINP